MGGEQQKLANREKWRSGEVEKWRSAQVFNFVFELRPKPGQALPVIKRVFPATNTIAQRVAGRTARLHAFKIFVQV